MRHAGQRAAGGAERRRGNIQMRTNYDWKTDERVQARLERAQKEMLELCDCDRQVEFSELERNDGCCDKCAAETREIELIREECGG